MKILIAGNGDTAVHLAKMLSRENQDVVVMGTDTSVLQELDMNYNVITSRGRAVSPEDLRIAGASGCDLFVAVTPFENHNLVSCELAKWLGAGRTIARIDNSEFLAKDTASHLASLGVDRMIYPEYLAAREIVASLRHPGFRSCHSLAGGLLNVFSVKLSNDAPVAGMSIIDFGSRTRNFHISLIKRRGELIIPGGRHTLEGGDVVYFTSLPGHEQEMAQLCGHRLSTINRVIVASAGKMAVSLAEALGSEYKLTVIDPDRERCLQMAAIAPQATVVKANFRDAEVLRDEGIRDNAAFVALDDSSETNIVSAIVAKDFGAVKTIAQIEDIQYFDQAQSLDIDTVINKKLLTSGHIYQTLLDSWLDSPRCLAFEDTEVIKIVAGEGSYITTRAVRELKLSADMTIAGLTRDGRGMLVGGMTQICPGDHVVVFCLRGTIKKVERLFR